MLIKVDRSITLDGDIAAPICLPTSADKNAFKNSICVSTGWGRISHRGILSDVLLKADQPIISKYVEISVILNDYVWSTITKMYS